MNKVLVTGVAGFIGSHVADHCLKMGMRVVGIDDLSGGFAENISPGVQFEKGSITDHVWLTGLFREHKFDFVYHLAAYAAEGLSHFIRRYNYETNLVGSVNLINESVLSEVKCFIFTSSIAVYGANQTPLTEAMIPRPEDPYGVSKYAVELDLAAAHHMFGLNYAVFRPHNVYGEKQNIADKYRNVIGIFMNQVMQGQSMTIFGDGLQTRAFSHVDDVAPIIARAPLVPAAYQQVFNVGADQPYTVLELAKEVARVFAVSPDIKHLPARKEVEHATSNHERVKQVFAPLPPILLHEGLQRMADWVRARGPMTPVEFKQGIEVPKNLPPSWLRRD